MKRFIWIISLLLVVMTWSSVAQNSLNKTSKKDISATHLFQSEQMHDFMIASLIPSQVYVDVIDAAMNREYNFVKMTKRKAIFTTYNIREKILTLGAFHTIYNSDGDYTMHGVIVDFDYRKYSAEEIKNMTLALSKYIDENKNFLCSISDTYYIPEEQFLEYMKYLD